MDKYINSDFTDSRITMMMKTSNNFRISKTFIREINSFKENQLVKSQFSSCVDVNMLDCDIITSEFAITSIFGLIPLRKL